MALPHKSSQPREVRFTTKFGPPENLAATLNDDHQTIEDAFARLQKTIDDLRAAGSTASKDLEARVKALEERPAGTTVIDNSTTTVVEGEPTPDELTPDQKNALKGTFGNPTNANRYVTTTDPRLFASNLPIGVMMDFAGTESTVPPGWLLCDGRAVNQIDYPELFAVLGSLYGPPDPVTFKLPDTRGRSTMGSGAGPGLTARTTGQMIGVEAHKLTGAQSGVKAHSHTVPWRNNTSGAGGDNNTGTMTDGPNMQIATSSQAGIDADVEHPNIHPVIVFPRIIKF